MWAEAIAVLERLGFAVMQTFYIYYRCIYTVVPLPFVLKFMYILYTFINVLDHNYETVLYALL